MSSALEHRQPTARGQGPARDLILSDPPSHLSKIKIYQVYPGTIINAVVH